MHDETPRLLLVEADELLSEITSFRLELSGFQVRTVRSGEEAVKALRGDLPDVVIVDLTLPDMDGIDLINQLSNDARTSCVPVLAFSIDADVHAVQRAHAAGAKDLLVIPYDPYVLEEKLEQLLQATVTA
jgi:DNA-binding response OmpR family regulator